VASPKDGCERRFDLPGKVDPKASSRVSTPGLFEPWFGSGDGCSRYFVRVTFDGFPVFEGCARMMRVGTTLELFSETLP